MYEHPFNPGALMKLIVKQCNNDEYTLLGLALLSSASGSAQ